MCSEIIESNLSRQKNLTFPALKGLIERLASAALSRGPIEPGQSNRIEPPQSNLSHQTKSRTVPPSPHRRTMVSSKGVAPPRDSDIMLTVTMAPDIGGASTSTAPLLQAVPTDHDVLGGTMLTSVVPLLTAVTTAPDIAGASTSTAPLLQALPTNPEVAGTSTSVSTIEAPPRKKAETAFLEKNSSITVLAIGIKDDNGAALIDFDAEPWTSLVSTTSRPQRDDLAEEVLCRYVSENLSDRPDMKRLHQPRNWDKKKLLKWLDDNPVTDTIDVEFLKDTVRVRRAAAERNAKARAEAKESDEKSGGAWYGPIPMLHLIMALVDSDEIRHAYTKRNDISNERIVLDNQKSVEKRARTVWELVADKWNDIKFEPETEVFEELHSEYSRPIKIPHHKVALLSLATPDKVQEKISTMNVLLQRLIRNWECSGQGDGGIDVINDCDKLVDHEFGQITNRSRGALHTRAAFLGTNQPYLLYFWEMLNKYQLLSTSFSELSSKISSKNGGKGVPSAINSYGKDIDSDIDEIDFSDVVSLSIEASSRKSTRKDSSSSTKKSK